MMPTDRMLIPPEDVVPAVRKRSPLIFDFIYKLLNIEKSKIRKVYQLNELHDMFNSIKILKVPSTKICKLIQDYDIASEFHCTSHYVCTGRDFLLSIIIIFLYQM